MSYLCLLIARRAVVYFVGVLFFSAIIYGNASEFLTIEALALNFAIEILGEKPVERFSECPAASHKKKGQYQKCSRRDACHKKVQENF